MFLLIRNKKSHRLHRFFSLHSTMFLLILASSFSRCRASVFTFHNVSINTHAPFEDFLLYFLFTFHNVSINTIFILLFSFCFLPLHSTMFLLIQKTNSGHGGTVLYFTFHNVSINTE